MTQIFNVKFLKGGKKPIKVVKNPDCWVIRQKFLNPGYKPEPGPWSSDLFNIPEVTVEIIIDFVTFREDRKIRIIIHPIGFVRRVADPYELMMGYPFDQVMCWKTPWGENFASWSSRVASNGTIRPTERELFNGSTRAEIRNETEKKERQTQIRYGR